MLQAIVHNVKALISRTQCKDVVTTSIGSESTAVIKGCATPLGRRILDQKSKDYRHEAAIKIFLPRIVKLECINAAHSNGKLECGPMPNLMVALPNIGGALGSTPQSLADAHY